MNGLANITGIGSVVVLRKEKGVSNSSGDWQDLREKDFVTQRWPISVPRTTTMSLRLTVQNKRKITHRSEWPFLIFFIFSCFFFISFCILITQIFNKLNEHCNSFSH